MPESDVEKMIGSLEREREKYASDTFFDKVKKGLMGDLWSYNGTVLSDASAVLKDLRPVLESLLVQNPQPLQEKADRIAADIEVPDSEIQQAFNRVLDVMKGRVGTAADLIERAKGEALRELDAASTPWTDEKSEQTLTRFLLEAQATGGLPRDKWGVNAAAKQSLESGDVGAKIFWVRNYQKLYQNAAPGRNGFGPPPSIDEHLKIVDQLEAERKKAMNPSQHDSRLKAEKLRRVWQEEDVDNLLTVARYAMTENGISSAQWTRPGPGKGSKGVRPRQRTPEESKRAGYRKQLRDAEAGLAKMRG